MADHRAVEYGGNVLAIARSGDASATPQLGDVGHHVVATRSSSSEAATATQSGDVGGGGGAIKDAAKWGHRTIECCSGHSIVGRRGGAGRCSEVGDTERSSTGDVVATTSLSDKVKWWPSHGLVLQVARAGLFCTTNYSTKYCSYFLELAEDPPAIEVIYLHKYFQIFIYFI